MTDIKNHPFYRFYLSDYSAKERLEVWRSQYIQAKFAIRESIHPAIDYQFVGYNFGSLSLGQWKYCQSNTNSSPLIYTLNRSTSIIRGDGYDNYSFNIRRSGTVFGDMNGRQVIVRPGEVLVADQARPYHREIEAGDAITLLVARDMLPNLTSNVHGEVFRGGMSQLLTEYLASLLIKIDSLSLLELSHAEQATLSLVRATLSPTKQDTANVNNEIINILYVKIKEYIRQYLQSPDLSPETICKTIGVSRSSLYRMFEQDGGVANYIRKRRLLAIRRVLATSANPQYRISELAYDYGFNSNTQLSRAFKQEFGHAPRDTWTLAANSKTQMPKETRADYRDWLVHMR